MNRTERFYKIKELLRQYTTVSFATLLAELEVSRSTLKRDMVYLTTRLNNPIEWSREAGGYRLAEAAGMLNQPHELPGLWFSSREIHALLTYGVYVAHGFVSSFLAKQTGFGEDDLELLWQALTQMFEHDCSAARGEMSTRGLYVFKHDSELGNAPAYALFDKLKVPQTNFGEVARSFDAYSVAFEGKSLQVGESVEPAPGVTLTRKC